MEAQVGVQLRTVSTSLRMVNSMPRNAEQERAQTLGTSGAIMWELPVELKDPRSKVLRYVHWSVPKIN